MLARIDYMKAVGEHIKNISYQMRDITNNLLDISGLFIYESDSYYEIQQRLAEVILAFEHYADLQEELGDLLCDIAELYEKTEQKIIQYYDEEVYGIKPPNKVKQYLIDSVEQVVLGNYSDKTTLLGSILCMAVGFTGLDNIADARDFSADLERLSNGEDVPVHQVVLDAVAFLPIIGSIKYADDVGETALDTCKYASKALGIAETAAENGEDTFKLLKQTMNIGENAVDGVAEAVKTGENLVDGAGEVMKTGDDLAETTAKAASGGSTCALLRNEIDNVDDMADNVHNVEKVTEEAENIEKAAEVASKGGSNFIKNNLINKIKDIRGKMPNTNLAKRGNMAVADVDVPGIKDNFVAHSKINAKFDKGGDVADFSYLKSENERFFTTYVDDQYPRYHDTEAKILEDIASQITDSNISGIVNLYSELPCCQSCSNIILEFRRKFPNIKLNVYVE